MNHIKYSERLTFIKSVVLQNFGLDPCHIEPVQYDPECEFPYNNFIYRIEVPVPGYLRDKLNHMPHQLQPGTIQLPDNVAVFVFRLSNAAVGLNDVNRVENEVATMSLFRDAMSHISTHIVSEVYGWGSAADGRGWILQEHMTGKSLTFKSMRMQDKRKIILQIAEIFEALRRYRLPDTVKEYGGLRFDEHGVIVSAPMTLIDGGPFQSYEALYSEIINSQLIVAEQSTILQGWQPNGVRRRLDHFLKEGLHQIMPQGESNTKVLVHGDLTTDNLLFNPEPLQITAILDFDWSYISSSADEFLRSFSDLSGKLPGPFHKDPKMSALREALLQGFPDPLPQSESTISWEVAKAWDDELDRRNIQRPRTIKGIDALSGVLWLSQQICPFLLCDPTVLKYRTSSQKERHREEAEKLLMKYLGMNGF